MFFDTETTWLKAWTDQIVQFWAIYWIINTETHEFIEERVINQFIKPTIEIWEKSSEIHWLTKEKLEMFWEMKDYIREFVAYIIKCDYIVWHNISFDFWMLEWEMRRHWIDHWIFWKKICTMKSYADKHNVKWPKLTRLYKEFFGKDFDDAHDAMADILATKDCFIELIKDWTVSF